MYKIQKKVLPVSYPPITSYTSHAALLSILWNNAETYDWIYSNYISLVCYIGCANSFYLDYTPSVTGFLNCPWVDAQIIGRKFVSANYPEIKQFLIDCINMDSYIFLIVNEQDIIKRMESKILHTIFIYGYDLDLNVFFVADFPFRNKYSYETVDIDTLCKGYMDVDYDEDDVMYGHPGIVLMNFNKHARYVFDSLMVKKSILDYLQRDRIYFNYHMNKSCTEYPSSMGVDVYTQFYMYISNLEKGFMEFDIRPPHVLYDHKEMMVKRIEFMASRGYMEKSQEILENAMNIRDKALILRNLCLKYRYTNSNSKNHILYLIDGYKVIEEMECKLYIEIANRLS